MPFLDHHGARLHYVCAGSSGARLLFIQGVGCIGNTWRPQLDALSQRHRTLAFDNRGIGQSTCEARTALTVEDMATDARALMDAVGWERCHVLGHSLGGLVAQRLALDAPGRVSSLTLMCTVAHGAAATALGWRMLWLGMRTRLGTRRMRRRAFLDMIFPPDYARARASDAFCAELAELFGRDLADSPPIIMRQLRALRAHDTRPELGRLEETPTLVLSGRHDPIARPEAVRALHLGIPGSRWIEVPDASHALPLQQPDYVNGIVRDFVQASTQWGGS